MLLAFSAVPFSIATRPKPLNCEESGYIEKARVIVSIREEHAVSAWDPLLESSKDLGIQPFSI